jgi:hypothetical protein
LPEQDLENLLWIQQELWADVLELFDQERPGDFEGRAGQLIQTLGIQTESAEWTVGLQEPGSFSSRFQIREDPDPVKLLKDLVTYNKPENDFLEFKGAGKITEPQIKAYWSKALSGFANTEGGIVVWGIRATKIPDPGGGPRKIDCATDLDLVPKPSGLMQLLRDSRLEATIDPVLGVDMFPVDAGAGDGSGFVVCLIPESTNKPHRAHLEEGRQYWQRIGDTFVIISHPLLRTLFYPQLKANLEVSVCIMFAKERTAGKDIGVIQFEATLYNRGTSSAIEMFAKVVASHDLDRFGNGQYWNTVNSDRRSVKLKTITTLHPGDECSFFTAFHKQPADVFDADGSFPPTIDGMEFDIMLCMLHGEPQRLKIMFVKDELRPGAVRVSQRVSFEG